MMTDPPASADYIIAFLNEVVKVDPKALAQLIETRVPCNEILAKHPSIQVNALDSDDLEKGFEVGFLGVLNGMVGTIPEGGEKAGWGYIAAVFEDDGSLSGFRRTDDPKVKPA